MSVCLLAGATLSSCLKDSDSDSSDNMLFAYLTVGQQDANNIYTLYADGGGIIYPSAESVYNLTESYSGLKDVERCYFCMTYSDNDYSTDTNGEPVIRNATLKSGVKIPVDSILSVSVADSLGISQKDSLFSASEFEAFWGYRGYLTAVMDLSYTANSSGTIDPTVSLVCDSIRTDSLFLTLCYNRHAAGSAIYGVSTFIRSYTLTQFRDQIPGSDSIQVMVNLQGTSGKKCKISREDLSFR